MSRVNPEPEVGPGGGPAGGRDFIFLTYVLSDAAVPNAAQRSFQWIRQAFELI